MSQRFLLFAIPVIAIGGYFLMKLLGHASSSAQEDGTGLNIIIVLALTLLGLAIPYWMLKVGAKTASLDNPDEKELNLRDIPDYQPKAHKE